MSRLQEVIRNTCLALATGLFTGGVVTNIISKEHALPILVEAYFPAFVFYQFYIVLSVIQSPKDARENKLLFVINLIIFFLLVIYLIIK